MLASIVVKDKKDCWIGDKSLYAPVINEPTIGINELLFEYILDEKIINNKNNISMNDSTKYRGDACQNWIFVSEYLYFFVWLMNCFK